MSADYQEFSPAYMAAWRRYESHGYSYDELTEAELSALSEHHQTKSYVDAWRRKEQDKRLADYKMYFKSQPAAPSRPVPHTPVILATMTKADMAAMDATDDGFDEWMEKHGGHAAPVWMVDELFDMLKSVAKKHKGQIEVFESRLQVAETEANALRARVAELETRPIGTIDAGVFELGRTYDKGVGCTFDGHYWVAQSTTRLPPGDGEPSWRLAVRRGKPGRSAA